MKETIFSFFLNNNKKVFKETKYADVLAKNEFKNENVEAIFKLKKNNYYLVFLFEFV